MSKKARQIDADFVQLARLALAGRSQDIQLFLQRASKRYQTEIPKLAELVLALLREAPTRASPLRRQIDRPMPVDTDSRLQLLRIEPHPHLEHAPILGDDTRHQLDQLLSERNQSDILLKAGLQPTRTVLFTGPPGVGKTITARWIANQLNRPLMTLDLAAVMSSFLGRTGNNVRFVLDYAKSVDCVLLIDELDAIAKRRDDQAEVGELKRLVTVLLQEIDDWPSSGLLLAATNHPDLLDPAVWRRFEMIVNFKLPTQKLIKELVTQLTEGKLKQNNTWIDILASVMEGMSQSDIERMLSQSKRRSLLQGVPLEEELKNFVENRVTHLAKPERVLLAKTLIETGTSQRDAHKLTGVSRDTIRKYTQSSGKSNVTNQVRGDVDA